MMPPTSSTDSNQLKMDGYVTPSGLDVDARQILLSEPVRRQHSLVDRADCRTFNGGTCLRIKLPCNSANGKYGAA